MNEQLRKAISYSLDFVSFIFLERDIKDKIVSVYLFGSSVRGEMDKESDVDIFINCKKENEDIVKILSEEARKKFSASKDFEKWKSFNFTYPISIKIGPLEEWELKTSIRSEGIELYSENVQSSNTEGIVLFSIELPKNKKLYLKIKRELFGRIDKEFKSEGVVSELKGKQLASNIFIVPKLEQNKIINILDSNKIRFSMIEFLKYID